MGKFNQYLGKTEMVVDGKKLELDVKLKDMRTLMTAVKDGKLSEETIDKIVDVFREIMKRSYPDEPVEEVDAFVDKKFTEFMTAFSIAMGWSTKKEIDKSFREAGLNAGTKKD